MTNSNNYFKTICHISREFSTAKENDELLQLIVKGAVDTMNAKAAALFLAEEKGDVFKTVAQIGLSDDYLHADPGKGRMLSEKVLQEGHLSVYDATADPAVENHDLKKAEGIASLLVVPVMAKGAVIGVLTLYTAVPRHFSRDEIDFLSALAEQGGMAIMNTRLLDRIRQNAKLFLDIAQSINSSLDIKKILHILTADISEALGVRGATIRLLDKDTGNLELVASYGLSERFLQKGAVSADKSIKNVLEGETVIIENAVEDDRIQYREEMDQEGIVSIICSPIRSGDEIIGSMRLFTDFKMHFPEDMVMMVNALADQGGLAIQNASMYLRLKDDKECLERDIWSHRMWF